MATKKMGEMRRQLRDLLGTHAEAKATDAFCEAVTAAAAAPAREGGGPVGHVVVELAAPSDGDGSAAEVLRRLRDDPGFVGALERLDAATREAGESSADALAGLRASPAVLLRDHMIRGTRERFYGAITPLRDEMERRITARFALRAEAMRPAGVGTSPTDVCWLNGAMRAWTDPQAVASLAADERVQVLDVPRRLAREVGVTGVTVGAVSFRKGTGRDGKGILVAVIDGEVALPHPGLGTRVIHRMNYTMEPWGNPDAHATEVAGIIGAASASTNGMAPAVRIYNYKVFPTTPDPSGGGTDFDAALALERALVDGARVANCSWGTRAATDGTSRETRAVEAAWAHGMTVVKSAGNNGPAADSVTAPADARGVITVGATDREGTSLQSYSSRGNTANGPRPHLVAPGGTPTRGVDSCLVNGAFGQGGFGTSFAAPHVTGLLALLLDGEPGLSPDQQLARLVAGCTPVPGAAADEQGAGLVRL